MIATMLLSANTSPLNSCRRRQAGTAITADEMTMIYAVAIYGFLARPFLKQMLHLFYMIVYFATIIDVVSIVQRSF